MKIDTKLILNNLWKLIQIYKMNVKRIKSKLNSKKTEFGCPLKSRKKQDL